MFFKNLKTTLFEGIIIIEISREAKLNALNEDTLDELKEAILGLSQNSEVKAAIITGAGTKAFVAGADISEFQGLNESDANKFAIRGQGIFALIENCQKPIIARTDLLLEGVANWRWHVILELLQRRQSLDSLK